MPWLEDYETVSPDKVFNDFLFLDCDWLGEFIKKQLSQRAWGGL